MPSPSINRRGFTLVELLVVIGIIALLISILLPALNRARRSAQTISCLANLRTMGQAMQMYASEHKGAIIGSASTSGRGLFNANWTEVSPAALAPTPEGMPIDFVDYITPMARMLRINLTSLESTDRAVRWAEYMRLPQFQCPSYRDVLATVFPGSPDAGTIQAISYTTAFGFLLTAGSPTPGNTGKSRISTFTTYPAYPTGYGPRVSRVGAGATKIYAADGGKFSFGTQAPNYDLRFNTSITTTTFGSTSNFSDFGPWYMLTSAYDRNFAPGNPAVGTIDARVFAFRHGNVSSASATSTGKPTFRLNAVFYDGHAETLDELDAANPALWLPRGTQMVRGTQDATTRVWNDVRAKYNVNATYTVP